MLYFPLFLCYLSSLLSFFSLLAICYLQFACLADELCECVCVFVSESYLLTFITFRWGSRKLLSSSSANKECARYIWNISNWTLWFGIFGLIFLSFWTRALIRGEWGAKQKIHSNKEYRAKKWKRKKNTKNLATWLGTKFSASTNVNIDQHTIHIADSMLFVRVQMHTKYTISFIFYTHTHM